jgi:NAD(P)-dependent dehydrogenase (short-subunit alcohol dehydrogenase family)
MLCDFASLIQIRGLAAATLSASRLKLHILVNNAASVSVRREVTEDGIERTFAVNHLGPFLLTNMLFDVLKRSAPARVTNLEFENGGSIMDLLAIQSWRTYSSPQNSLVVSRAPRHGQLPSSGRAVATNIWSQVVQCYAIQSSQGRKSLATRSWLSVRLDRLIAPFSRRDSRGF